MEKKSQIKILLIVLGILIVTSLLAIFISMNNNENNDNNNDNNINKEIVRLDNDVIFTLQEIINNYYSFISTKDYSNLYNLLDEDYVRNNNISIQNISKIIKGDYLDPAFFINKVLYNNDKVITYYFINGYMMDMDGNSYEKDINYLIIVKNNKYVIVPLGNIDIDTYSKNYNLVNKNINNNNIFKNMNISDKSKITSYIGIFLNMLNRDTLKAYNMLGEKTKSKYSSYENFINVKNQILEKLTPVVFSYSIKNEDNKKIYYVKDNKQNSIELIEYYPMDFVINF